MGALPNCSSSKCQFEGSCLAAFFQITFFKEKKMEDKKKNGKEKAVEEKGHGEKAEIKKLMNETMRKLSVLAKDINMVPRKKYTGWKLGSKLLVTIGPRNKSFMMWIYQYSEKTGNRINIEPFEIKVTGKASEKVVEGMIKQVRKNYDILTAVRTKREKAEPKKETFAEATIVNEIPIKKALKEAKKKEVAKSA